MPGMPEQILVESRIGASHPRPPSLRRPGVVHRIIAVQLPFPGDQRPVARLLHQMAEGPLLFRQDSEALPVAVLEAARHQLHAGVRAERLGIGVVETNPLTGQAVQHRRRVGVAAVGAQGFVAQIVRQDQDDVGALPSPREPVSTVQARTDAAVTMPRRIRCRACTWKNWQILGDPVK